MIECIPGLLFLGLIGFTMRLDVDGEKQQKVKEFLGQIFIRLLDSIEAIVAIGALCLLFYIGRPAVIAIRVVCCIVAAIRGEF